MNEVLIGKYYSCSYIKIYIKDSNSRNKEVKWTMDYITRKNIVLKLEFLDADYLSLLNVIL